MSYRIFIGNDIDKLSDFIELYIFNKTEHINLFRTLKELKLLFPIIRELEDYSEDVNLYEKEIEQLIEEIEKIQKNDSLKNNYFLCHVLKMVYSYFVSLIYVFYFLS